MADPSAIWTAAGAVGATVGGLIVGLATRGRRRSDDQASGSGSIEESAEVRAALGEHELEELRELIGAVRTDLGRFGGRVEQLDRRLAWLEGHLGVSNPSSHAAD